jgi:hypothetical protein
LPFAAARLNGSHPGNAQKRGAERRMKEGDERGGRKRRMKEEDERGGRKRKTMYLR